MKAIRNSMKFVCLLGILGIMLSPMSHAAEVGMVHDGHELTEFSQNCGGGFDFLPNGDIVAFNGQDLYIFDANHDGDPVSGEILHTLPGEAVYGSFVKVSPSGDYILFGESTNGFIYRYNMAAESVAQVHQIVNNFDLVFLDNNTAFISASPDWAQCNIHFWEMTGDVTKIVANIAGPSGPITLDRGGNLYYVKSDFTAPVPLLRFDNADLHGAISDVLPVLGEGDAEILAILPSGYDIEIDDFGNVYATDFNGFLYVVHPDGGGIDTVMQVTSGFTSFTTMAFYKRDNLAGPFIEINSKLAVFSDDWAGTQVLYAAEPKPWDLFKNPIVTCDLDGNGQDEIVIDFGQDYGIWVKYNNTLWENIHTISPEEIAAIDITGDSKDELIINFGDDYGIWIFNADSQSWTQLHNLYAESLSTGFVDDNLLGDVIVDFGEDHGIWIFYNNSSWSRLHDLSCESLTAGNVDSSSQTDIIVDFGQENGVWSKNNDANWEKVHDLSP